MAELTGTMAEQMIIDEVATEEVAVPVRNISYCDRTFGDFFHMRSGITPNDAKERVTQIIKEKLQTVLPVDIRVTMNHGGREVSDSALESGIYGTDDEFKIILWAKHTNSSMASTWEYHTSYPMAWDMRIPCQDSLYDSCGDFLNVTTPEGFDIAEFSIAKKFMIIHFDVLHADVEDHVENCFNIFSNILGEVNTYITEGIENAGSLDELISQEVKILKERYEKAKIERIKDFWLQLAKRRVKEALNNVKTYEGEVTYLTGKLATNVKKLEDSKRKLMQVESSSNEDETAIKREIEQLQNLENVVGLDFNDSHLIVQTGKIYSEVKGYRYYFGEYDIHIPMTTGLRIKVLNRDTNSRRRSVWGSYCQHPHISEDGIPCWGNASTPVAMMLGQGEFGALTTMIISYLESVNLQDTAGKYYYKWDIVDEEGNVVELKCSCGAVIKNPDELVTCNADGCDTAVCPSCSTVGFCKEHKPAYEMETCCKCDRAFNKTQYDADGKTYRCAKCGDVLCIECGLEKEDEDGVTYLFCSDDCENDYSNDNDINLF